MKNDDFIKTVYVFNEQSADCLRDLMRTVYKQRERDRIFFKSQTTHGNGLKD